MASSTFLESKSIEKNNKQLSSNPITLFRVRRLQTILIEQLQMEKGGLSGFLKYLKTDRKLSDPAREALLNAVRLKLIEELLQAVIDDDRQTVEVILDFDPTVLLAEPAKEGVTEIESKKTWQRFISEKAFVMAVKRNQIEMVKLILPYFDKLDGGKTEVLRQWPSSKEMNKQEEKQPNFDEMIQALIDIIVRENCANGVNGPLNEETEEALNAFRKKLLPDKAITLDQYFDIEQFLLAAYIAFDKKFNTFQTWDQRDVFCIRVIGFLQSLVSPELGKIFCEGSFYVVYEKRKISARAASLKLLEDESYYRESCSSKLGLGFEFLCGPWRRCWGPGDAAQKGQGWALRADTSVLKDYVEQKQQVLASLRNDYMSQQSSMMLRR